MMHSMLFYVALQEFQKYRVVMYAFLFEIKRLDLREERLRVGHLLASCLVAHIREPRSEDVVSELLTLTNRVEEKSDFRLR